MQDVPYGFCHCGCGELAPIAKHSRSECGWIKGQPIRFIHGHHPRLSGKAYRVEDRGYMSPCWVWLRSISPKGYGQTHMGGRSQPAHRYMYERHVGAIPEGMQLDHLCRVRNCVNSAHLEPVTNAENQRRGLKAKITPEIAAIIRDTPKVRGSGIALAAQYGVSPTLISRIRKGRMWK